MGATSSSLIPLPGVLELVDEKTKTISLKAWKGLSLDLPFFKPAMSAVCLMSARDSGQMPSSVQVRLLAPTPHLTPFQSAFFQQFFPNLKGYAECF